MDTTTSNKTTDYRRGYKAGYEAGVTAKTNRLKQVSVTTHNLCAGCREKTELVTRIESVDDGPVHG